MLYNQLKLAALHYYTYILNAKLSIIYFMCLHVLRTYLYIFRCFASPCNTKIISLPQNMSIHRKASYLTNNFP